MSAHHPTGRTLYEDDRGRLYVVSREVDGDGTLAYTLSTVCLTLVEAFRHKYEAAQAIAILEAPEVSA